MIQPQDIRLAIEKANKLDSKIDQKIFALNSPSGKMGRCLMNNLGALFGDDLRYLEIGTERGVSFISVLNGNNPKYAVVIDPWNCGTWLKPDFDENINNFIPNTKFKLINEDCFKLNPKEIIEQKINFYFYDAEHSVEKQKMAFCYYNDVLDDEFLTVIDDWNDPQARKGTAEAFKELEYEIKFGISLPTEFWDMTGGSGNPHTYWNGLGIFLIKKKS